MISFIKSYVLLEIIQVHIEIEYSSIRDSQRRERVFLYLEYSLIIFYKYKSEKDVSFF